MIEGWLEHRCQLVFLTRGGEGATVFSRRHGTWSVPARAVVDRRYRGRRRHLPGGVDHLADRTAAGFGGGRAALEPRTDRRNAQVRRQAAALTCSKTGPDLPFRHQLD